MQYYSKFMNVETYYFLVYAIVARTIITEVEVVG